MKIVVTFLLLAFAVPAFARDHKATFKRDCGSLSQSWLNGSGWKHFYLLQPNPKNALLLQVTERHMTWGFGGMGQETWTGTLSLVKDGKLCTVTNHGAAAKHYLSARAHQAHVKMR